MSRIGKLAIVIPQGVEVSRKDSVITVKKGNDVVEYDIGSLVDVDIENNNVQFKRLSSTCAGRSHYGLHRSNLANIITGLHTGFKIILEVNGVGYKVAISNGFLVLTLGYSHDIFYEIPDDVSVIFEKPNMIIVSGKCKIRVGQVAAEIKKFKKPDVYKNKGIKEQGEILLKKVGKKK